MACWNSSYDTDKSEDYLKVYDLFFSAIKEVPIKLLEIGVYNGGSLYLWRDYFKKGRIAGIDINHVTINDESGRINFYQGSQDDELFLQQVAEKETGLHGFDIIIDDASHVGSLSKASFDFLFNRHLKQDGIYVIEDWGTGYWQDWPDGSKYKGKNHDQGMVKFIKELIDECGMADITKNRFNNLPYRESKIKSMTIFHGQVFLIKR